LIASYKQQIGDLNNRILELEQEKSNLNAELINLRHEYEVRLSVNNFNSQLDIKNSAVTHYNDHKSEQGLTSPVTKFGVNSGISSPKD